jgi:plasmid rolling circle replication initiator protein Rep
MTDVKIQVLVDRSRTGKDRPWERHRTDADYLAAAYDDIDPSKADRVRNCATELTFSIAEGRKHLESAWFCRVRLCPMCAWRRSLRVGAQMHAIMDEIAKTQKLRYIMLTLTVKNVTGDQLDGALDKLTQGYRRLTERKRVKDSVVGWYRAVEITHNLSDDTYHPHIHCVMAVKPGYFNTGRYVNQTEWTALWRDAIRADYDPIVDVRIVKGNTAAAVAEVAKYAVKSGDYIIPDDWDLTQETITLLDHVLANRRFVGFGGIFKHIHKKLKLGDTEDGDLVHVDDKAPSEPSKDVVTFVWYSGYRQYIKAE